MVFSNTVEHRGTVNQITLRQNKNHIGMQSAEWISQK